MAKAQAPDKVWENPLVPHARLREIYVRMVEARALAVRLALRGTRGQEAARVSTALSLEPGDLACDATSDRPGHAALTSYLRGAALRDVLRGRLPAAGQISIAPVEARVWSSLGAAAALKMAGASRIATVYVESGEAQSSLWREALSFAARQELPVFFVILPRPAAPESGLDTAARRCGVPCIGVDAADAVALYRVVQESLGRARAGGGAALMECVAFPPGARPADPLKTLGDSLLARGLVTDAWMSRVGTSFAGKLDRIKLPAPS